MTAARFVGRGEHTQLLALLAQLGALADAVTQQLPVASSESAEATAPAAAVRTCRRSTSRTGSAWPRRAVFWVSA